MSRDKRIDLVPVINVHVGYQHALNGLKHAEMWLEERVAPYDPDLDPLLLPAVRSLMAKVEARCKDE